MNKDRYKVILSLSHHRVAFEYYLHDGDKRLMPIPGGQWPEPLAFYVSPVEIYIGKEAAKALKGGVENAFGDYFERLKEKVNYTISGQARPIGNLLLDASETVFRNFFKDILLNRCGELSENRAKMPLTIVYEADIEEHEQVYLKDLFRDSGYNRANVVAYDEYIARYIYENLAREYVGKKMLVAWTEGVDLILTLFDPNDIKSKKQTTCKGLGVDSRMKYVEDKIWESVQGKNSWLNREQEQETIREAAAGFLNGGKPMVKGTILLSDRKKYNYSLALSEINIQGAESRLLKEKFEEFLKENALNDRSKVVLLLRGVAANNDYFNQNLSHGFFKTIKSDKKLRDNTMKLLITEDSKEDSAPSLPTGKQQKTIPSSMDLSKKWRTVRAEARGKIRIGQHKIAIQILEDFYAECKAANADMGLLVEVEKEIGHEKEKPCINPDEVKRMEQRWREVRASARGRHRANDTIKATAQLKQFLNEVLNVPGTEKLQKEVNAEISELPPIIPRKTGQQDGQLLQRINRLKKSVELRKNTLEECKKTKNMAQIGRIIKELNEYIDLCDKAGVAAPEYKKLCSEYKKIK